MKDTLVIKKWTERAEKDLADAEFNLKGGRLEVAVFLYHQAAEKALKALYISEFNKLWKIHDLKTLAEKVGAPRELLVVCDSLNPAYLEMRYPVDVEYSKEEANKAAADAKKVVMWAKKTLKT